MKDVKSENKKERKKLKNYSILILIFIACMALTLYLCKWYKVYDEYQKETPIIRGTLLEIVSDDLEHYVLENPTCTIYMCISSSDVCRNFEKDFKKLVTKQELTDEIIYLNLTDLDQESFVNEFNSKYNFNIQLTSNYPAIVTFRDGNISSLLQASEGKELTISKVKEFLELNQVGE